MKHMHLASFAVLSVTAGALLAHCGSSSNDVTATPSTDNRHETTPTPGSNDATLAKPPVAPLAEKSASLTTSTFAVRQLYMGDTMRGSAAHNDEAWKKFGYDLDGTVTRREDATPTQCKPLDDGTVIPDGDKGIDNAFGYGLLPALSSVGTLLHDPSKNMTDAVERGDFTLIFQVNGLSNSPSQSNTGLRAQIFSGAKFDPTKKPEWKGADNWPVAPDLLIDGKTLEGGSKIKFDSAYISNGTWVNGAPTDVTLAMTVGKYPLVLRVQRAIITAEHPTADKLTNGTIAGVIALDDVIKAINLIAGSISKSACPGTQTHQVIVQMIRQAADIRVDGSLTGDCDAISIGLGFNAEKIGDLKAVAAPAEPFADACAGVTPPPATSGEADGGTQ